MKHFKKNLHIVFTALVIPILFIQVSFPIYRSTDALAVRRARGISESSKVLTILSGLGFSTQNDVEVKDSEQFVSEQDGKIIISTDVLESDYLLLLEVERVANVAVYISNYSDLSLNQAEAKSLATLREAGRFLSFSAQQQDNVLETLAGIDNEQARILMTVLKTAQSQGLQGILVDVFGADTTDARVRDIILKTSPNYQYFVEHYGNGNEEECRKTLQNLLGHEIDDKEFFQIVIGTVGRDALMLPAQVPVISESDRAPPSESPSITVIGGSTWLNLLAGKLREEVNKLGGKIARTMALIVATVDDGGSSRNIQDAMRASDIYNTYIFSPGDTINDWKGFADSAIQAILEVRFKDDRYEGMSFEDAVKEQIAEVEKAYGNGLYVESRNVTLYLPKNWPSFVADLLNIARHVDERFISTGILPVKGQSLRNLFYVGMLDYAGYIDAGVIKGGMVSGGRRAGGATLLQPARLNKDTGIANVSKLVANILGVSDIGYVIPSTHDEGVIIGRLVNGNIVTEQTDLSRPAPRNGEAPSIIGIDANGKPIYNTAAFTHPSPIYRAELWTPQRDSDGNEILTDTYNEDGSRKRQYTDAEQIRLKAVQEIAAIDKTQDAIILTCGSVITSVTANLMVHGIVDALKRKKANSDVPIILALKPLTSNETWGMESNEGSHIAGILETMERSIQHALDDPAIRLDQFITDIVIFDVKEDSITDTMRVQIAEGMAQEADGSFVLGKHSHLDRRPRGVVGVTDLTAEKQEELGIAGFGIENKSEVEKLITNKWPGLEIRYLSDIEEVIDDWRWYLPASMTAKALEYTYRFNLEDIWNMVVNKGE